MVTIHSRSRFCCHQLFEKCLRGLFVVEAVLGNQPTTLFSGRKDVQPVALVYGLERPEVWVGGR